MLTDSLKVALLSLSFEAESPERRRAAAILLDLCRGGSRDLRRLAAAYCLADAAAEVDALLDELGVAPSSEDT